MVKNVVSACLVALAAHPAAPTTLAADLPARKEPPPVVAAPVFTWTGFHLGYNRGYGGGVYEANVGLAAPPYGWATQTSDRASGWITGLQAGYDRQFGNNVVLGVETDLQWSDITGVPSGGDGDLRSVARGCREHQPKPRMVRHDAGAARLFLRPAASLCDGRGRLWRNLRQKRAGASRFRPGRLAAVDRGRLGGGRGPRRGALGQDLGRAEYLYLQLPGVAGLAAGVTPTIPALAGTYRTGTTEAHLVRGGLNYRFAGFNDLMPAAPQGDLLDTIKGILFQDPTLDWSGVYGGVSAGYGGGALNLPDVRQHAGFARATNLNDRSGGAIAGGQIGYQRQIANRFVLGVESDAQWSGVTASHQETAFALNGVAAGASYGMDWFGTTRARLGLRQRVVADLRDRRRRLWRRKRVGDAGRRAPSGRRPNAVRLDRRLRDRICADGQIVAQGRLSLREPEWRLGAGARLRPGAGRRELRHRAPCDASHPRGSELALRLLSLTARLSTQASARRVEADARGFSRGL